MSSYGYYSVQQFDNMKNTEREFPYIYYKNIDNIIVQVTEVTNNPEYQSKFNDAIHLGKLKQFHSASANPIYLSPHSNKP